MAVERKFNNSAIGSWAGYIYQGLCAVYVVLHYFHDVVNNPELRDKYGKYILYLDSYDDFSTMMELILLFPFISVNFIRTRIVSQRRWSR